jgi:hypothetical protein
MIGFGAGISRSAVMFLPPEEWPNPYKAISARPELEGETLDVLRDYSARVRRAVETMRQRLTDYDPDVILLIADDHTEVFGKEHRPTFTVMVTDELWGYKNVGAAGFEPDESERFVFNCHTELARYLLTGLTEREFDMSWCEDFVPRGRPKNGVGHAFRRSVHEILPRPDIPVVMVTMNNRYPPVPSTRRFYKFGAAIADVVRARPEKIAAITTGGLSVHDIDEPMDRWVLDHLAKNDIEPLLSLFMSDSRYHSGGTTEIKNWIALAGTCRGAPAEVLDYVPSWHGVCGIALATFSVEGA